MTRGLRYWLAAGCAAGMTMVVAVSVGAAGQVIMAPGPPSPSADEQPRGTSVISGLVIDATTGVPIAEAVVSLAGRGIGPFHQLTDGKYRFIFSELPASDGYTLRATRPGYFDGVYGAVNHATGKSIALADGQWFQHAQIEMIRPGAIGGTVLDEHGEPPTG